LLISRGVAKGTDWRNAAREVVAGSLGLRRGLLSELPILRLRSAAASTGRIGFSDELCRDTGGRDASLTASDFEKFGLLPELVGRFSRWVRFDKLSKEQMAGILRKNTIEQHARELRAHGVSLSVEDSAVDLLVTRALDRGIGARGLEGELSGAIEEASFEAYSEPGRKRRIVVKASGGKIGWDLSLAPKKGGRMTTEDLKGMVETLAGEAVG
jgi:hypothetical protein